MLKFQLSIVPALLPLAAVAQTRPNIVLFLVDDMGLMDTSLPFDTDSSGQPVRQPLNQWYNTPNMERLATTGIRFTSFYAQSVSSPSRASLLTGQNAARHRT
ncbi:MAG: sulfatase-like hydrolase/transferase, partial [Bacteroidaceae bacterium]|nr:sulfatase-like hydrolase/transferase [Bacteroidaceae bacterium]